MLVNGRQKMVERAVLSFRAQNYANKRLLIFDTGVEPVGININNNEVYSYTKLDKPISIGNLRNMANAIAIDHASAEVILHWDSDDWSHPQRMLEQVSLWQAVDEPCVGYNEMLFWDERAGSLQAWIYRNGDKRYALGTSLCYSAATWKKRPFPPKNKGEDLHWINNGKCLGISSIQQHPRMMASIHGDNTESKIKPGLIEWKRAADHDEHCRRIMAL